MGHRYDSASSLSLPHRFLPSWWWEQKSFFDDLADGRQAGVDGDPDPRDIECRSSGLDLLDRQMQRRPDLCRCSLLQPLKER